MARRVTVTLDDGTVLQSRVDFPPGHDKNPLTDAQLRAKFLGLALPALGRERADLLWERVQRLEADARPQEMIRLLGDESVG